MPARFLFKPPETAGAATFEDVSACELSAAIELFALPMVPLGAVCQYPPSFLRQVSVSQVPLQTTKQLPTNHQLVGWWVVEVGVVGD